VIYALVGVWSINLKFINQYQFDHYLFNRDFVRIWESNALEMFAEDKDLREIKRK
jgi:hypothetical protein